MPVTAQKWPPVRVACPRVCFVGSHRPAHLQCSGRRDRDGRRSDDHGGRQPQRPRQEGRQVSASALFLRSKRSSRTLLSAGQMPPTLSYGGLIPCVICMELEGACHSQLRRSNSWSHLYGDPVAEISATDSSTKVPILMPSPQSLVLHRSTLCNSLQLERCVNITLSFR
jgi:hypothetical protein